MFNPDETVDEINKYLNKLSQTIHTNASFTLINVKIHDKQRIDDILCCIEGCFPKEYKKYLLKKGFGSLKSHADYIKILKAIKNRFLFSSSCYAIKFKHIDNLIGAMRFDLRNDMRILYKTNERMF